MGPDPVFRCNPWDQWIFADRREIQAGFDAAGGMHGPHGDDQITCRLAGIRPAIFPIRFSVIMAIFYK